MRLSFQIKNMLFAAVALLLSLNAFANDGVYLSSGGVIYPTKETKISLDKEILSFVVRDGVAHVQIQFEFNNPENTARKMLIGFQAPSPDGDVDEALSNSNQISNFTVMKDGQILPYQLKAAECEDCELKDPENIKFSQGNSGLFVFLFEVTFKPGVNRINHSYSFPASSMVYVNQIYGYILTTGSKWAGGKIKDLTVNIDMGLNQYFYVNDVFGQRADWSIVGTGKVTSEEIEHFGGEATRMVRTLNGYLQIKVKDLKPMKNIEFGIMNKYTFINILTDGEKLEKGEIPSIGDLSLATHLDYTEKELRILRNTVYAQHGYSFNSPDLKTYFSQFPWYIPNPNLKMEDIVLSEKEKAFLNEILKNEK